MCVEREEGRGGEGKGGEGGFVEWLIFLKEKMLLEGLTLEIFFVDFRR